MPASALSEFWTEDCVNHATPGPDNRGLDALSAYHTQFMAAFSAFSNVRLEIVQQVAEGARVVTHVVAHGRHSGPVLEVAPTGRDIVMPAIRIDRIWDGKIAEHWSVSDLAGLMQQIQG